MKKKNFKFILLIVFLLNTNSCYVKRELSITYKAEGTILKKGFRINQDTVIIKNKSHEQESE